MSRRKKSNGKPQFSKASVWTSVCLGVMVLVALLFQDAGLAGWLRQSVRDIAAAVEAAGFTEVGEGAAYTGDDLGTLEVHVLDCGQADAILVLQDGHAMLVDAGEREHGQKILDYLGALGVDTLEYAVFTHPHSDHIGGAAAVLRGVRVENVILSHAVHTTKTYENLLDAVEESGAQVFGAAPGDTYTLGGAEFTVLSPDPAREYDELNDYSVAFRLCFEGSSMLFTGDMGKTAENAILAAGYPVRSDVLKAGHHGSSTASGQAFLDAVAPSVIVMTVEADSDDNLPNPQTLERFERTGAAIFRSDEDGLIVLRFDEGRISVGTERAE